MQIFTVYLEEYGLVTFVPLLLSEQCTFAASGAGSTIPLFSDTTGHLTLIQLYLIDRELKHQLSHTLRRNASTALPSITRNSILRSSQIPEII